MEYTINWNVENKFTANFALFYIGYRDTIVKITTFVSLVYRGSTLLYIRIHLHDLKQKEEPY